MRIYLLNIFFFLYLTVSAQVTDIFPENYTTYFNNTAIVNPGFVPEDSKAEFFSMYRQRTGAFQKIASYSLTCSKVFRKENNTAHLARVFFSNEKEGPYINKPRAYFNYAYVIPLAEETSLSAGLSAGFTQVYFSAPSATASGNSTMPDGAFGITFRRKKFFTGISSQQVFNAESNPIKSNVKLRRYYNLILRQEKDLSPSLKLRGNFMYQLLPSNSNLLNLVLEGSYNDILSLGGAYRSREGLALIGSVEANLGDDKIFICFAYNTGVLSKLKYGFNSIEINFAYKFN
ncbi:MAG: PorP/SprF family type IX secretion system membrane protein [Sporocytophaga sp.]|uniref:PorP/SprF family type IX secretion system membrane protein n=1 Tax=Sporocytophaga sp. TaxID=2231183 RepID=UPI001B2C173D|nr:PorP/SprF family type IX secretion system membrane protein [Sporocytophaga sp.]MBO9699502.1 PorP/SprF family type IX secretion system membrane protein [Sporocytophaga sp.]